MADIKPAFLQQAGSHEKEESLDRQQLAEIYDRYHQRIYRYVYRQVGEVETARDISAEVFHRFIKAVRKGLDPVHHPAPWLYRTAHNLVVDYYRRQKHRQHLPLNEELVGTSKDPDEVVAGRISAEQVRAALIKLTPDQRQVITLKYLEGLSNQEVATVLNKTVGAVKALQHRALVALNSQLVDVTQKGLSHE